MHKRPGRRSTRERLRSWWFLLGQAALVCAALLTPSRAEAQSETPTDPDDRRQAVAGWVGLMTDWQVKGPWSVWFDTHYNTRAFYVLRPGITYKFERGPTMTAGYAYVLTDPGTGALERQEHRPWAQAFLPFKFSDAWTVSQRFRVELRVRQKVADGEVAEGWIAVPRWRSQTAVSYWFQRASYGDWFTQASIEVLANGGRDAGPNFLDQSRLGLMLGFKHDPITLRAGYMDRFVPGDTGINPTHEHDIVFWIDYRMKRKDPDERVEPHSPEIGNP